MALKTPLRMVTRRISEVVRKTASSRGLDSSDYALVGSFDEKTDRISLVIALDREIDRREWYAAIFREIRREFADYPYLPTHVGLVIRQVQNLDEAYWDLVGPEDETDLTELLELS